MMFKALYRLWERMLQMYLNLKIIWKMAIGFGVTLVAVLFVTVVSQWNMHWMYGTLNSVIDRQLEPMVYINDIRSYISELEVSTRDALLQRDEVALRYIHHEFLPNTVRRTVDYSFEQLENQATGSAEKAKLDEIHQYWLRYYDLYDRLTASLTAYGDSELTKAITNTRYFLVGGFDRMVETNYRQKAVLARNDAKEAFAGQQVTAWTLVLIVGVVAFGISFLTAFTIISPLIRLAAASRRIASGDLNVQVPGQRGDEFGEVADCFNLMSGELKALVEEIKNAADKVNENSQRLLDGTHGVSTVTQQLLETLAQVAVGAGEQQQKVSSIHEVVRAVSQFSDEINQITHRVEELSGSAVARALHGEEVAGEVAGKMRRIQQFMKISDEMMSQLQTVSAEIGTMAASVQEIAEQTNLLSLNAAIEAARAGEQGRGFGVVAESIGQLAVQTKSASSKVTQLVRRIQEVFQKLSGMIETENAVIREGELAASGLNEVFDSIIEAARQVNQESGQVTRHTVKLAREHTEVLKAVEQITRIADQHKEGTEHASSAAEEHYSCTQEMISASQILVHWGDNLRTAVSKFKN